MALTKADKGWIEEKFATKDDLTASNVRLGVEFDKKIAGLEEKMSNNHDEMMTALDQIMSEVVKGREHDLVVAHKLEDHSKRLDRHEKTVGL